SELVATAIHTVKPENIATFLGHKLDPRYEGEVGNNYNVRIEGVPNRSYWGLERVFLNIFASSFTDNNIRFFHLITIDFKRVLSTQ
ncbi:MAG: hypothetical protein PHU11_07215, partial [Dysgonamonadaceae bacterium]|nr:hypothetical protein [Dysgonamonadaceae bacterium]